MAKAPEAAEAERRVATIKLTAAMRKQIVKELGVDGGVDKIPDSIRVTRVPHEAVGLTERDAITAANSWVLVLV